MWRRWVLGRVAGLVLLGLAAGASAPGAGPAPEWQRRRVALDRMHPADEFRIFYATTGPDALPDRTDINSNGVPDRIDNVALQLTTARSVYVDVLKLRHPLKGPRYAGRARFIDVHVATPPFQPGAKRQNGQAGDAVVNYHRPCDPEGGAGVLTIDIANDLPPANLTPAHELFHSFQYGYTLFKNAWFLEGTARWSEHALRKGAGDAGELPATPEAVRRLFEASYDAAGFWNGLVAAIDPDGRLRLPESLQTAAYAGGGARVVGDASLNGADFMRRLLEALDRADDAVSKAEGLDPQDWKEARQKSPANHAPIWAAVIETLRPHADRCPAVARMVGAVGSPPP